MYLRLFLEILTPYIMTLFETYVKRIRALILPSKPYPTQPNPTYPTLP